MSSILDSILQFDQDLLIYLHHLGSQNWDAFWIFITNPLSWLPLFLILFFLGLRVFKLKKSLLILALTIGSVLTSLGIMYLLKISFQRLRPINDILINSSLRKIITTEGFSFISGHSMVSFTIATFVFLILKRYYKWTVLIFLFPLFFAYSRIYLAVHYPLDIFFGMIAGIGIGILFHKISKKNGL